MFDKTEIHNDYTSQQSRLMEHTNQSLQKYKAASIIKPSQQGKTTKRKQSPLILPIDSSVEIVAGSKQKPSKGDPRAVNVSALERHNP